MQGAHRVFGDVDLQMVVVRRRRRHRQGRGLRAGVGRALVGHLARDADGEPVVAGEGEFGVTDGEVERDVVGEFATGGDGREHRVDRFFDGLGELDAADGGHGVRVEVLAAPEFLLVLDDAVARRVGLAVGGCRGRFLVGDVVGVAARVIGEAHGHTGFELADAGLVVEGVRALRLVMVPGPDGERVLGPGLRPLVRHGEVLGVVGERERAVPLLLDALVRGLETPQLAIGQLDVQLLAGDHCAAGVIDLEVRDTRDVVVREVHALEVVRQHVLDVVLGEEVDALRADGNGECLHMWDSLCRQAGMA